jgi:hypothetical protein
MRPYLRRLKMKNKFKNAKNVVTAHVSHYQITYAFLAGVSVTTYAFYKIDRVTEWNQFLALKGLTEEFYNPEAYLESLNPTF